tara:strand:+ start:238 stop:537 length:300 start_codon:yes stop_codon:yes gene_type:complete
MIKKYEKNKSKKGNMKKYKFNATRSFTQAYEITIEAKNEEEARWKAHDSRYNNSHEWTEIGDLEADDKLVDIELINNKGQVVFEKPMVRRLTIEGRNNG